MINLASLIVASAPVAEAAMSGETTALLSAAGISALLSLALLEIVLGIDNVVFIAILAERVEESKQKMARYVGLALAMIMRIGLLFAASAIVKLDKTVLFTMPFASLFAEGGAEVTARDLVLILGGGFLIAKATMELHHMALGDHSEARAKRSKAATLGTVLTQIVLMDLIFSVDSVITAVGMTDNLLIMVIAVMLAIGVMMVFSGPLSRFVKKHPNIKVLAISFLVMIGFLLVVDGFQVHVPRGYIYTAMAFALMVDLVQMKVEKNLRTGADH